MGKTSRLSDGNILHMNCVDVAAQLPNCVNLIYADILYGEWEDVPLQLFKDCLVPGGSLYLQTDYRSVANLKLELDKILDYRGWIIWSYDWGGRARDNWGKKHDDILYYVRSGAEPTFNVESIAVPKVALIGSTKAWKIPTDVWPGNFYTTSAERIKDKRTGKGVLWQKPEWILDRVIKASSNKGDLVFEPYLGSGTACAVAKKLGRRYIGCDIDPYLVDLSKKRLRLIDGKKR